MTDGNRWLLTSISKRTTKDELRELIAEMPLAIRLKVRDYGHNKVALYDFITAMRRAHWDSAPLRLEPPTLSVQKRAPRSTNIGTYIGTITASEANDWLRNLPLLDVQQ